MLKFRIISSCLMGAAFLVAVQWLPAPGLGLLALALSLLGQHEFYGMAGRTGIRVFTGLGMLAGAALITAVFVSLRLAGSATVVQGGDWENGVGAAIMLCVLLRALPEKNSSNPVASAALTLMGVAYVPYLLSFYLRLGFRDTATVWHAPLDGTGRMLILYAVVVVKCSDIGAYTAGRLFGRHKLFPRLSPKKTWEGLAGGLAVAVPTSVVFALAGGGQLGAALFPGRHAFALGALLGVASVVGDLFESLLKRVAGAKDSSALIPGNGGMLDVFDSLLFTAPVMYIYTLLFLS